jgi:ABC-2 type transport system ATP-binding protein
MDTLIQLTSIYKTYDNAQHYALNNLNLRFDKGKIIGLLGPNGAGKTTTISIIFGLTHQDKGSATILGYDNIKQTVDIKKKVGIIPQQIALYPDLTCLENLMYFGHLYGLNKKQQKEIALQHIHSFGLENHFNKKIKEFSGGMKRRANIIAGILHDPELVILDEPTAGVDIHSRQLILDFLCKYNKEYGKSIIYTSHQLEEADKICHELAILKDGSLIVHDTTEKLKQKALGARNIEEVFMYFTQ